MERCGELKAGKGQGFNISGKKLGLVSDSSSPRNFVSLFLVLFFSYVFILFFSGLSVNVSLLLV